MVDLYTTIGDEQNQNGEWTGNNEIGLADVLNSKASLIRGAANGASLVVAEHVVCLPLAFGFWFVFVCRSVLYNRQTFPEAFHVVHLILLAKQVRPELFLHFRRISLLDLLGKGVYGSLSSLHFQTCACIAFFCLLVASLTKKRPQMRQTSAYS